MASTAIIGEWGRQTTAATALPGEAGCWNVEKFRYRQLAVQQPCTCTKGGRRFGGVKARGAQGSKWGEGGKVLRGRVKVISSTAFPYVMGPLFMKKGGLCFIL